ncbi:unnamed protein product [Menidia menidia]|uniref:(Atlantic silverside) hypothetical protein n=1 Tax=Menidia menidia TaxID=238744 RepID=A0A8S4AM65_9TELE|nr:unnamed protein product [Menidia menidia]
MNCISFLTCSLVSRKSSARISSVSCSSRLPSIFSDTNSDTLSSGRPRKRSDRDTSSMDTPARLAGGCHWPAGVAERAGGESGRGSGSGARGSGSGPGSGASPRVRAGPALGVRGGRMGQDRLWRPWLAVMGVSRCISELQLDDLVHIWPSGAACEPKSPPPPPPSKSMRLEVALRPPAGGTPSGSPPPPPRGSPPLKLLGQDRREDTPSGGGAAAGGGSGLDGPQLQGSSRTAWGWGSGCPAGAAWTGRGPTATAVLDFVEGLRRGRREGQRGRRSAAVVEAPDAFAGRGGLGDLASQVVQPQLLVGHVHAEGRLLAGAVQRLGEKVLVLPAVRAVAVGGRRRRPVPAQRHAALQPVEGLRELVPGVGQGAGDLHVAGAAVGPAAGAFLGAFAVLAPVGAHVAHGAGVVVDVELLLAEGEPAVHHGVQPQLALQQLLGDDEPGHDQVEGEVDGRDFVAPQHAAHHHRLGLDVHQLVAVALPDEVEVVRVAGRAAGHRHVDGEAGFLHDVPDGVLAVLHLELQRAAGAEAALALEGQADALVRAMVHANQARHLASADLADGVELPDLLENSVEPRFLSGALGVEDLRLAH